MTMVYLVAGFLDAGKTNIILNMVTDQDFSRGMNTLLICCEEGDTEYDEKVLKENHTALVMLEDKEELTGEALAKLEKTYQPERVIIEYNSMWGIPYLAQTPLPRGWELVQMITLADAATFDNYMLNMRQQMTDPMREADLVIVNRCQPESPRSKWRRTIRSINPGCNIIFENPDGSTEDGVSDEDLPYDMKAEVIDVPDEYLGLFYLDGLDHPDRYNNRKVRLNGQVMPDNEMPKGCYFFGRMAMTCCSDDLARMGWVVRGSARPAKRYIKLTAICHAVQGGPGQTALMLEEIKTENGIPPKEKYVTFVNL